MKDATATALYGTRGANGVMIVTTKSGANLDKPVINFTVETNMSRPTSTPKFVDGATYMKLYNEAIDNLGSGSIPYSQEKIQGTQSKTDPYLFPDVNWYNELFNKQAYNQKINFNIRGGGKKVDYFMSVSFNNESGMMRGRSKEFFSFDNNIKQQRYSFQNNINARLSESSRVTLRLSAQMMNRRSPNFDNIDAIFGFTVRGKPVDYPILYPADGTTQHIKWGGYGVYSSFNPLADLVSGYRDKFESTMNASMEYEQKLDFITEGLKFNALASFKNWSESNAFRQAPYNMYSISSYTKKPDGTYDYTPGLLRSEEVVVLKTTSATQGDRKFYLQANFDYNRTFNDVHAVNAMVVYHQEEYNKNNYGYNLNVDNSWGILLNSLPKRKQGMAARISYAYDNRYLFEVNAGYNGSENFAKGHRWGFFPSFALGYNISEEKFFEPLKKQVQQLKIRGSWGLVGNDHIEGERFIYMPSINLTGRGYTTGIMQDVSHSGPAYNRYANYNLTWEVGEKWNVGVDLRLFNALTINADLFKEHRRNIFQKRGTLPTYLGPGSTNVFGNTAEMENKGFDFSVDYSKKFNKDLTVFLKGTFT